MYCIVMLLFFYILQNMFLEMFVRIHCGDPKQWVLMTLGLTEMHWLLVLEIESSFKKACMCWGSIDDYNNST